MQCSNGYLLTIRQGVRDVLVATARVTDDVDPCGPGSLAVGGSTSCLYPQSFPSTTYVHAIVWGQVPRFRLIIVISPLAIMLATIIITLASLYRARRFGADYIASFNTMDTLHIIAACSLGNAHTLSFPNYDKDIGLFSKDV
jgi:hypothetical protein